MEAILHENARWTSVPLVVSAPAPPPLPYTQSPINPNWPPQATTPPISPIPPMRRSSLPAYPSIHTGYDAIHLEPPAEAEDGGLKTGTGPTAKTILRWFLMMVSHPWFRKAVRWGTLLMVAGATLWVWHSLGQSSTRLDALEEELDALRMEMVTVRAGLREQHRLLTTPLEGWRDRRNAQWDLDAAPIFQYGDKLVDERPAPTTVPRHLLPPSVTDTITTPQVLDMDTKRTMHSDTTATTAGVRRFQESRTLVKLGITCVMILMFVLIIVCIGQFSCRHKGRERVPTQDLEMKGASHNRVSISYRHCKFG